MEKKYKVGVAINIILTVVALLSCIVTLPNCGDYLLNELVYIALCLFTIIYAAWGYSKPHGNLLRDLFITFALCMLIPMDTYMGFSWQPSTIMFPLIMMAIAFVAGRLNRIDQNKVLLPIITLLLAHEFLQLLFKVEFPSVFSALAAISPLLIWLTLCGAYFTRFAEHKEAGLVDNAKKTESN